ncbi:MAG: thiamine phosphate synthase [Chloroflexi bacterium]|nr:thiamine phosphate synthase [Chloroflexota bacterium]
MTPYTAAQMEALKEGLLLLEGVVTQPVGLSYDLRAARESLFPDTAASRRERPAVSLGQALDALGMVNGAVALLLSMGALELGWVERSRKVLARVQQHLGARLRGERATRLRGLYVIVDPQTAQRDVLEVAGAALRGGARVIQLRDKAHDKGDQLPVARRLVELCTLQDALCIINDHADLAAASGAHGLHLGQHDLPIAQARRCLEPWQLVGRSNALVEEAVESQAQGADYIAVGTIFPTSTKEKTRPAGLETLRRVKQAAQVPVVAIGGITEGNVEEVIAAGADAVAVISAVGRAPDPEGAARRLSERVHAALARRGG